jgi:hypothetical protein
VRLMLMAAHHIVCVWCFGALQVQPADQQGPAEAHVAAGADVEGMPGDDQHGGPDDGERPTAEVRECIVGSARPRLQAAVPFGAPLPYSRDLVESW